MASKISSRINSSASGLTVAQGEALMITHSIPDGKLYRALEMIDDPHFKALDTIIDIETGLLGWLEMRNDG